MQDKLIWHPFTQEQTAASPLEISRGQGAYLYDKSGIAYLDLISSWWVNLHGHAEPNIASAIYQQAQKLEHVIFAGFTHQPAQELCQRLQPLLPANLSKFFFSDNGSTAVEVALKMAYQYWHNKHHQRHIFISFNGGYHGDTFGAMAVSKQSGFHTAFSKLFFEVLTVDFPATWDDDTEILAKEQRSLEQLHRILTQHGEQVAAIIMEPLVQGASGMRMCRPEFIQQVIKQVRAFDILVIFDEVMTGFGRSGSNFAVNQLKVEPDFICLSKGITGGFLPLALTVTTEKIYQAFLSDQWDQAFAHGHSYTANPLACAAAIASLELLQAPETQQQLKLINQAHKEGLNYLNNQVGEAIYANRCLGTIAAFTLNNLPNIEHFKTAALAANLLLRPLKQHVYLMPPYCIAVHELPRVYQTIAKIIKTL